MGIGHFLAADMAGLESRANGKCRGVAQSCWVDCGLTLESCDRRSQRVLSRVPVMDSSLAGRALVGKNGLQVLKARQGRINSGQTPHPNVSCQV
jgi:hypothetical protein